VPRQHFSNGKLLPGLPGSTLIKIITDEGAEGYYLGGSGHGDQDGMSNEQNQLWCIGSNIWLWGMILMIERNSGIGCG